jgi:LPS-assembly protein
MNNGGKISLKYLSTLILTLLFFCITVNSSARYSFIHGPHPADGLDTVPKKIFPPLKDTVIIDSALLDTLPFHSDTVRLQTDTFHVPVSKDSLDAPIAYTAQDSVVLDVPTKNITLYNKATTKYKDINLEAYNIRMDQPHNLLLATFARDTAGAMVGRPKMTQADQVMNSDSMVFNMKTQKGITVNTFTQNGEIFVQGEKMKKISKNDYYASRAIFTTCNLDTPHFAFRANKMKLVNKKMAITGPVHPEFEGVPIPLYIPFGYFPISQGRHSGFLAPTFDVSSQYGLGLDNIGYYKVLNDNFDVSMTANIYSYGGYNLYLRPEYRVRYRYSGHLYFAYQNTRILNNDGKSPYIESRTFNLQWSHTVDSKAHPGQNFSANVNIMSPTFNSYNITNPTATFANQIQSSIAFSKTFGDGKYNLTISASHNQNNNPPAIININAPSVGFTAITLYPFAPKEVVGTQKWYEKLGIGLTSNVSGLASMYDTLFSFHRLLDTFKLGMQNSIPISLTLPQLGFLQISPGISYQNVVLNTKYDYTWDSARAKLDTTSQKGVYLEHSLSFSLSLSTAVYGTFQHFGKNSRILGIRHTMRPTISFSYSPDLSESYYKTVQYTTQGNFQPYNLFAGNVYSAYGPGKFGGLSFTLDNNIEMKVKSKTDTSTGANEKVKLIDGFGFAGSYNYLADSFKLSNINLYLRSTLFKKVIFSFNSNLDPYQHDTLGIPKNIYAWQDKGFNLGKITNATISLSTSFKSKPKDPKKDEEYQKQQAETQSTMTQEEEENQLAYIRAHAGEFVDFNVTWSLNVSFSFNYSTAFTINQYASSISSALMLNGDFNLTEKWKMGFNCYYDVRHTQMQSLTTFLSRDMHCWQLAINVTPVGPYRSFNITINPKSNILRDLKINRVRTFY